MGSSWIVQEITLASSATLHCGSMTVEWSDFADAVDLFGTNSTLNSIWEAQAIPATHLVYASSNLCRKSKHSREFEKLKTLDTLLSTLTSFVVTMPQDSIYALLALAKDTNQGGRYSIQVDYRKHMVDVCKDFLNFSREKPGLIDIICIPWAPIHHFWDTTSWICSGSMVAFSRIDGQSGRQNADSLVGKLSRKNYSASGSAQIRGGYISEDPRVTSQNSTASRTLYADGFVVDTISGFKAW
jgi:hypothetical protein